MYVFVLGRFEFIPVFVQPPPPPSDLKFSDFMEQIFSWNKTTLRRQATV